MLACELPMEMRVRQNWLRAIADAVDKATNDQTVRDALMATWSTRSDSVIDTAADDEDNFWQVPSMNGTTDGGFVFRKYGSLPTFDPEVHWGDESDDEIIDLTDAAPATAQPAKCTSIQTAQGTETYQADWGGVEAAKRPTHEAAKCLHRARQMVDSSRWWALRWPNNAISLFSRACGLNIEKTRKFFRRLRLVMTRYIADLWQIIIERRHAQDIKMARVLLRVDWARLRHTLGATTDRRRKRMPDWVVVSRKPIYTIKSLLAQWEKVKLVNFHNHSQRKITGFFHRTTGVRRSSLAITTVIAPPATGILTTNIEQRSTKRQRGIREFTIDE